MIIKIKMEDMGYNESHGFLDDVSKLFGVEVERVD